MIQTYFLFIYKNSLSLFFNVSQIFLLLLFRINERWSHMMQKFISFLKKNMYFFIISNPYVTIADFLRYGEKSQSKVGTTSLKIVGGP